MKTKFIKSNLVFPFEYQFKDNLNNNKMQITS